MSVRGPLTLPDFFMWQSYKARTSKDCFNKQFMSRIYQLIALPGQLLAAITFAGLTILQTFSSTIRTFSVWENALLKKLVKDAGDSPQLGKVAGQLAKWAYVADALKNLWNYIRTCTINMFVGPFNPVLNYKLCVKFHVTSYPTPDFL